MEKSLIEFSELIGVNAVVVILIGAIFYFYNKKLSKALLDMKKEKEQSRIELKEFQTEYQKDIKEIIARIDNSREMSDEKFSRINERISDQNALILKEMSAINQMREMIGKELSDIKENNIETRLNQEKNKQDLIAKFDKIRSLEASQNEMIKSISYVTTWIENNPRL